jgi:4-hydroxybenzoate polyprenyltransferase
MNRYFTLSRTTHGLLDISAPAFCALLWMGAFPPWPIILLSLATAFAAYTSIYTLNDLVGLRFDREKFAAGGRVNQGYSVDCSERRHPLARNEICVRNAMLWAGFWFALALVGSYRLNPVIVVVLVLAALVEVLYVRLLKVTHLRAALSGLVKTSGPIAAILVVDTTPDPGRLLLMVMWLFFWEIGGQNIPSDWNDTVEDGRVRARTIPLQLGLASAGRIILASLSFTVLSSAFLPLISPGRLGLLYVAASLVVGYWLLLRPGLLLYRVREGTLAARLFDSASYYPLANLALISAFLAARAVLPA